MHAVCTTYLGPVMDPRENPISDYHEARFTKRLWLGVLLIVNQDAYTLLKSEFATPRSNARSIMQILGAIVIWEVLRPGKDANSSQALKSSPPEMWPDIALLEYRIRCRRFLALQFHFS
ncbi:hypothetical protein TNCV_2886061 [Trichonephila clavipes]|nr:hypothetical protein TNCV_2886061 [Trichonephila clavipes]